jgi:hypothetical protein
MDQALSRILPSLLALALVLPLAPAAQASEGDEAPIKPYLDLRYRLETVDQQGLSAQLEGEAVIRAGPRDFNDTVNGRTAFPVVADASDVLLNQAILRWRPVAGLAAAGGRQAVNLDNQRWIGSVGWRQNDQTLDAIRITAAPTTGAAAGATLDYLHAWRVNRVFGPDSPQGIWHDTDIDGARAAYAIDGIGTVSAYGYWLDIPAAPSASTQTLGVRLAGEQQIAAGVKALFAGEYARQTEHGGNPGDLALDYLAFDAGIAHGGASARVGLERLEGDGSSALQTPLATLHAFNGWADKFLVTPPDGLRDLYVDLGYRFGEGSPLGGLALRALWHDFNATRGSRAYGQEFNAQASYPLGEHIVLLAKIAHYDAQGFATNTTKAWFSVEVRF